MGDQNRNKGRLLERLLESSQQLSAFTLLELVGARRILIENHLGISAYGRELICVKTSYGQLCIKGCNMELAQLSKNQLVITGDIHCILPEERK